MLSMVMVAVLAFSFKVADSEKTVQTMSLPVSNKVIVLDNSNSRLKAFTPLLFGLRRLCRGTFGGQDKRD